MHAVDGIQVAGSGQLGGELAPGHLEDLVGDVSLDHFHKVLHLVPVELQLTELHRAAGALHQGCGSFKQTNKQVYAAGGEATDGNHRCATVFRVKSHTVCSNHYFSLRNN